MKNIKKIFILILIFIVNISYASDISSLEVIDDKTINVSLNNGLNLLKWEVSWEIKVLSDVGINFVSKDIEDSNKISLVLWTNLEKNLSYSLLSVSWIDWSMNFNIDELSNGLEIENEEFLEGDSQWITKLVVVDNQNVEVYFSKPIEWSEFNFKLLKEIKLDKITYDLDKLYVSFTEKLKANNNYILIIVSIVDSSWLDVFFEDWVYEFSIEEELINSTKRLKEDFNSATQEGKDIKNIPISSETTPEVGASTWVLVLLTFIINTCIYIGRARKMIK